MSVDPDDTVTLLREMATGPASTVFVAERQRRGTVRLVAVKILHERSVHDAGLLLRVRDRVRALGAIGHRHLICIEDVVRVGDHLGLVSPWVEGLDVIDWVEQLREREVVLPARVICDVLRSTAIGLDAAMNRVAHGARQPLGLTHRDLRPTNVMIDRDGECKVLDLGAGYTSIAGRQARAGVLQKGLVRYLGPSRREGKRGGPSDDVYALGILAVELFRGRWLRRLHSQNPAHDRHLAEVVATMPEAGLRAGADELSLRNLLLRMVAFDPDARPSSAEVAHTLRALGERAPGSSLEAFANAWLLPLLPAIPEVPDLTLPRVAGSIVDEAGQIPDGPLPRFAAGRAPAAREDESWEETDEGWRPIEELDLDDEGFTPLAAPPRVSSPPRGPVRPPRS